MHLLRILLEIFIFYAQSRLMQSVCVMQCMACTIMSPTVHSLSWLQTVMADPSTCTLYPNMNHFGMVVQVMSNHQLTHWFSIIHWISPNLKTFRQFLNSLNFRYIIFCSCNSRNVWMLCDLIWKIVRKYQV
jgi:hypothetical protein